MLTNMKNGPLRILMHQANAIALFVFLQGGFFFFDSDLVASYSAPTYSTWDTRWVTVVFVGSLFLSVTISAIFRQRTKENREAAMRGEPQYCESCNTRFEN
jgi:predicted membrane channel-forming protein YqfA (hemolysin III family)